MSNRDGASGSHDGVEPGDVLPRVPAAADEDSGFGTGSPSSWSDTGEDEIQRELVASRVFGRPPLTIDRFVVEQRVGAGATAEVYAAHDPLLDRRVAIKVLASAQDRRIGDLTARLIREARALAHLSHRNVVSIYEVGQWNGRPYIAMELIEGTTLAQWLAARPRDLREILAAFLEAGRGLAAAHERGHVHRDFKPANVLVAHDGRVVVSDFGLVDDAAPAGGLATGSEVGVRRAPVGTPAYVAPEQRAGAPAHPSADVYSFALSVVEAVLGSHPAPESDVRWQAALRGRLPRAVYRALCAALALRPEHRTATLRPLLEALSGRREVVRRRRLVAFALAGACTLALAVVVARRASSSPLPALPGDPPVLPGAIWRDLQALVAWPPEARDDAWRERARTWLMLPIPTRVPCGEGPAHELLGTVGDEVVVVDARGALTACSTQTGAQAVISTGVRCAYQVDLTTVGAVDVHDAITVWRRDSAGWRRLEVIGPTTMERRASPPTGSCWFTVSTQGIAPPKVVAQTAAGPKDEVATFAAGELRISSHQDRSLWRQRVGAAPQPLVTDEVLRYRFDAALQLGVVVGVHRLQIVELASGRVVADAEPGAPRVEGRRVDIARDGSAAVALGLDGPLQWWRAGETRWRSVPLGLSSPADVRISDRGDRVLVWDHRGRLIVAEPRTGRRYVLAEAQQRRAYFLDDDQVVASDDSGTIWRWSLAQQRSWLIAEHPGDGELWGFATCAHDAAVVTAFNRPDHDNAAMLSSSPRGAPQRALRLPAGTDVFGLGCERDEVLAGTRNGHLLVWDRQSGLPTADLDLGVATWAWTLARATPRSGPTVDILGLGQTSNGGGRVILRRNGELITVAILPPGGNTGIGDIQVSSDGRWAIAVASSGYLLVIDVARAVAFPPVLAHTVEARRARFIDRDRAVVTAGNDGYLRRWRLPDGQFEGDVDVRHGAIFDLDVHGAAILVATSDGHVGSWDLASGKLVRTYSGHLKGVATARFDPAGRWIVSADLDGEVWVHRTDSEAGLATLIGHQRSKPVRHARILDDGTIITASDDGTVRLWQPPYGASTADLACELERHMPAVPAVDCGPGVGAR